VDNSPDSGRGLSLASAAEAQFKEQYAISRSSSALYSVARAAFKAAKLEESVSKKVERAEEACCLLDMIVAQRCEDYSLVTSTYCLWGDVLFEMGTWLLGVDMLAADRKYIMANGKYYMAYLRDWRKGNKESPADEGIRNCREAFHDLKAKQFIVQEGVLVKQGEIVTSWKARYFVLGGTNLTYWKVNDWERRQTGELTYPMGTIPLNTISGMIPHNRWPWPMKMPCANGFHLVTQHRAYHLATPQPDQWMKAIQHILSIQQVVYAECQRLSQLP